MMGWEEYYVIGARSSLSSTEFQVYVIPISSIKRYVMLDLIGGFAFILLGRIAFNSDLLCIACNIIASQMLNYVIPTPSA